MTNIAGAREPVSILISTKQCLADERDNPANGRRETGDVPEPRIGDTIGQ